MKKLQEYATHVHIIHQKKLTMPSFHRDQLHVLQVLKSIWLIKLSRQQALVIPHKNGATDIENMEQSQYWARDCSSFGKTHFNGNVTLSQHRDEICMAR